MATRKTISRGIIALLFVLILGYAYFEARTYLSGPQLSITAPEDGFSASESHVIVSGTARNISEITLNGNPIFVEEQGVFERLVPLAPGYAVIDVSVKDRYGRTKTILVHGTYTPVGLVFPAETAASSTQDTPDLDAGTTTDAL